MKTTSRRTLRPAAEPLEARIAPASLVSLTTGDLLVNDGVDGADTITISVSGGNYHFADPGGITAGAGASQIDANNVEVPIANVTGTFSVLTNGGADSITFSTALSTAGDLTVNTGTGADSITISGALTAGGTGAIALTSADVTGSGDISTDGGLTVTNTGTASTLSGVISGAGVVTKAGTGTLTFSNTNTFSGGVDVLAGRLVALDNGDALSSGDTVAISSGATLELKNTTGSGFSIASNTFNGGGTLQKTGADTIFLGGVGVVTIVLAAGGLVDVQEGELRGSGAFQGFWTGNLSDLNIASGAVFNGVEGDIEVDALTGAGTLQGGFLGGGSVTVGVADGSGTFTGILADDPGSALHFIKAGAGTQILTGTSTFTGTTTISGGTLQVGNGGVGATLGTSVVTNNAALVFNQSDSFTFTSDIAGTGTLEVMAGGITVDAALNLGGDATFTSTAGITFNNAVTMAVNKSLTASATGTSNGTISLAANSDLAATGTGAISLTTVRNITTATGSSVTTGTGALTLSANAAGTTPGGFVGVTFSGTALTSTSGNITVIGKSGAGSGQGITYDTTATTITTAGAGTLTMLGRGVGADGVYMEGAAHVIQTENGDLSVTGTTNSASPGGEGISFYSGNTGEMTVRSTGSGDVTLEASTGGGSIDLLVAGMVLSSGPGGNVNLFTDQLSIFSNATVVSSGTVTIRPLTVGRMIDLGTETAGSLSITPQELGTITFGAITIGNATSGAVTISTGVAFTGPFTLLTAGTTTIANGGSLEATGFVTSPLGISAGGTIAPGGSGSGIVNTGNLSFASGATFTAQINGSGAGFQHDQLDVNGTVSLGGATLSTSGTIASVPDQVVVLIANNGTDAVSGTFAGLPQGADVLVNGTNFVISYNGGTGNDVVLTQTALVPAAITVDLVAGDLDVADTEVGGKAQLTFVLDGSNLRISDALGTVLAGVGATQVDAQTVEVLLSSITGFIHIDAQDGNDKITLDLTGGNFLPALGLNFDADTGVDALAITGGAQVSAAYTFTGADVGNVLLSAFGVVNFTGTDAISNTGTNVTTFFTLPGTADLALLQDDATAGNGLSILSSTAGTPTFPRTTFAAPLNDSGATLNIDLGAGADTLTIASLDSAFAAALSIVGGANADTVTIATALTLGSGDATGDVTIDAEAINLNHGLISTGGGNTGGTVNLAGTVTLGESLTIATGGVNIFFGGTVNADSAAAVRHLTLSANLVSFTSAVGGIARLDDLTFGGFTAEIFAPVSLDGAFTASALSVIRVDAPLTAASATLISDQIRIDTGSIAVGAGSVTLHPINPGNGIDIGGSDNPGLLGLTDAELDRITAASIAFGDIFTGAIAITAPITRSAPTNLVLTVGGSSGIAFVGNASLNANGGDVTLALDPSDFGGIASGTASVEILANSLTLIAGNGGIGGEGNPLTFNVNSLTSDTATVGGPQFLKEKDTVLLGGTGITTGAALATLFGGTFTATGVDQLSTRLSLGSASALNLAGFDQTIPELSGGGDVALGGALLSVATGNLTGVLSGAGNLAKTGTGTFALTNSGSTFGPGTIIIEDGILEVKNNGALGDLANTVFFAADTSILRTTGSFTTDRTFNIPGAMATVEVAAGTLTFEGTLSGGMLDKTGTGTLLFGEDVTGDIVVSEGVLNVDDTKLTVSGPGDIIVHVIEDGMGGTVIDEIEFIETDTTTNLVIKGPTDGTMTTINTIMSADPANEIGSIKLGPTVILGNGMDDGIPDVQILGRIGSLTATTIAPNTIIELGKGLAYSVDGDETTPDSYNNRPDIKIGSVGAGTIIDVTGNGIPGNEPGALGGGGLGKVVIESWDGPGIIRTTQSIENFTLKTGDCFITFQIDPGHLGAESTADMGKINIARGSWGSTGSEIEGTLGSFKALAFLEGATLSAGNIKKLTTSTGDFAGTVTLTDAAPAVLGSFAVKTNFTGRIEAAGPIKALAVKGNFTGSLIAQAIGSISALSFDGATTGDALGDPLRHDIRAIGGSIGTLKATAGGIREYEISASTVFSGFSIKNVSALTDAIGIDHVNVRAAQIGNIAISLASPVGAALTGIRDSVFVSDTSLGKTTSTHSIIGSSIIAGSTIAAVKIGTSTVFADFTGSQLLAGVSVGQDGALGGTDDSYTRAAAIAAITITGKLATSTIASGIAPGVSGVFGDGDDLAAPGDFLTKTSGAIIKALGKITLGAASGSLANGPGAGPHTYAIEAGSFTSLVLGGITTKVITTGSLLHITDGPASDDITLRVM